MRPHRCKKREVDRNANPIDACSNVNQLMCRLLLGRSEHVVLSNFAIQPQVRVHSSLNRLSRHPLPQPQWRQPHRRSRARRRRHLPSGCCRHLRDRRALRRRGSRGTGGRRHSRGGGSRSPCHRARNHATIGVAAGRDNGVHRLAADHVAAAVAWEGGVEGRRGRRASAAASCDGGRHHAVYRDACVADGGG